MKQADIHWPYVGIAYFALLSFGLLDNARGPLFPEIIRELSLEDGEASWFFAIASLVAFLGSYGANYVLKVVGSLWGLRWGLFFIAFGFLTMAFSQNLLHLLLTSALFGLGLGLSQVFEHVCIQEGTDPVIRRRIFNGLHTMYALAALFAPLLTGILLEVGWSWRLCFIWFSLLPGLAFLTSLFIRRIHVEVDPQSSVKVRGREYWHIVLVASIISLYVTSELTISTRLVLYVQREFGIVGASSTHYLTGFFVMLLLGRATFFIFDFVHWSNRWIMIVCLLTSILSFVAGLFLSPWFLAFCGLTMAPVFAVGMDYISKTFKEKASRGFALSFAIGSILIVLMHNFVGVLTEWYGIRWAMLAGPFFLTVALLLLFIEPVFFNHPKEIK